MVQLFNTRCGTYRLHKEINTKYHKNNNDKSYLKTEIKVLETEVFLIVTYITYVRLSFDFRRLVKGNVNNHIYCVYLFCKEV